MNKVYLRFSNGAVSYLVDPSNTTRQSELIDAGFYLATNEDGSPVLVDSGSFAKSIGHEKDYDTGLDSIIRKSKAAQLAKLGRNW